MVADLMETDRLGGPRLYESHPDARHLRARIVLDDGSSSGSPTRGASATASSSRADEIDAYFASRLGIEPLDGELTPEALLELAAGRRAPLKSFLLNQTRVAGIGNIYADEALFRARLHPLSPAGSMRLEHCEELARRDRRGARGRARARRLVDRRLPRRPRRARLDAGRVPRPHPRGPGVRALRAATIRRIVVAGPLDLLLPRLPEAAARAAAPAARQGARVSEPLAPPEGFLIGHWTDPGGRTGCTAVIAPAGQPRPASTSAAAAPGRARPT